MEPKDKTFYEIRHLLFNQRAEGLRRIRSDRSLLNVRSGLGETLLHWMMVEDNLRIVKSLIELGAEVETVNDFGSTPLQEATQLGLTEMCLLLLANGAQVTHKNDVGMSVIASAIHLKRHAALMGALLDHIPTGHSLANLLDESDIRALSTRDDAVARLLQKHGLPSVENWDDIG